MPALRGIVSAVTANFKAELVACFGQPVAEITATMVRKEPGDWEALYRQGVALADLDKPEDAARSFRQRASAAAAAAPARGGGRHPDGELQEFTASCANAGCA